MNPLNLLPVTVVDVDRDLALKAAKIKAKHAISYADCFAIALAQIKNGIVITGDPEFKKAEGIVHISWLPVKPKESQGDSKL